MKITKRQLRRVVKEGYNSMSSAGMAMAKRAKRQFAKDYPEIQVGIDGREGWITVNGKKAVNMSQASRRHFSMDDVIDEMKKAYLGRGYPMQEAKTMKITKRQLKRIIKEEQMTLNQAGVDAVLAMADQIEPMYRVLVQTAGQSSVAEDPLYEQLEGILLDLPGQLEDIAAMMVRRGAEGNLK